jgi:hypothetical protein
MLAIHFEQYRPATITIGGRHWKKIFFADKNVRRYVWQVSELIILKRLTCREDLAWMNQEQAIAINRILVK